MENKNTKLGTPARSLKRPTIGIQELALIGWLAQDPQNRFAIESGHNFSCYEKLDPRADGLRPVRKLGNLQNDNHSAELRDWFGGKIGCRVGKLLAAGHVVVMPGYAFRKEDRELFAKAVADVYIPGKWNPSSVYVGLTESGGEWWRETGRHLHAKHFDKLAAKRTMEKASERSAVFGWVMHFDRKVPEAIQDMLPAGIELPLPELYGLRPMFTATVVRERSDRLYFRDVQPVDRANSLIARVGIRTHGKLQYVERDRLILDHASPSDVRSLAEFDRQQQEEHTERCRRAAEELLPIIRRYADSTAQNEAEHVDRMRELLEGLRKDQQQ